MLNLHRFDCILRIIVFLHEHIKVEVVTTYYLPVLRIVLLIFLHLFYSLIHQLELVLVLLFISRGFIILS